MPLQLLVVRGFYACARCMYPSSSLQPLVVRGFFACARCMYPSFTLQLLVVRGFLCMCSVHVSLFYLTTFSC
ncbi:hypothetical protein EDM46_02700 [Staphylococcus aureus]|nr:hypothetical protein EDM46_02700 [Staphylococcus aureus]